MKNVLLILIFASGLFASLRVDTTYSTFGAITKEIGKDLVDVQVLGSSKYDPHFIVPKPSLISKLRRADLLIINGGGLEIGWLPPIMRNANNAKIQEGAKGFLDMSHFIDMIDKPASVSRGFGDIHAQGNPHYILDPHNILILAKVIANRLEQLDLSHKKQYEINLKIFLKSWNSFLDKFDNKMSRCKSKKVVQYHELFNYFLKRYSYESFGNIEPLPGIAPSSKNTIELINSMRENGVKLILQDVYHEKKTAKFMASKAEANVRIVPHEVGAVKNSDTLENFYSTIGDRICQ